MSSSPVRYLEPNQIRASRPPGAIHPRVEIVDELVVLSALVKRVFPLSNPDLYVSILEEGGKELGILRTLEGLDPDTAKIFGQELDRRYYTPHVTQITGLRQEAGMWKFSVQTQRGAAEFYVRNWRDNAHEITPGRWQILSVDGARFEILQAGDLDPRSQKLLDQLL